MKHNEHVIIYKSFWYFMAKKKGFMSQLVYYTEMMLEIDPKWIPYKDEVEYRMNKKYNINAKTKENRPFIYLAVPYSHPDSTVRSLRFARVNRVAGKLMAKGHLVLSPISMAHPIAEACELPGDYEYWRRLCEAQMSCCYKVVVLCLEGCNASVGVAAEIKLAKEMGIPVEYVGYGDFL